MIAVNYIETTGTFVRVGLYETEVGATLDAESPAVRAALDDLVPSMDWAHVTEVRQAHPDQVEVTVEGGH